MSSFYVKVLCFVYNVHFYSTRTTANLFVVLFQITKLNTLLLLSCHEIGTSDYSPDLDEIREVHQMIGHNVLARGVLHTLGCWNLPLRAFPLVNQGPYVALFPGVKAKIPNYKHFTDSVMVQSNV